MNNANQTPVRIKEVKPYVANLSYPEFMDLADRLTNLVRPVSSMAPCYSQDEISLVISLRDEFRSILSDLYERSSRQPDLSKCPNAIRFDHERKAKRQVRHV
jgi:hypothetical protein